MKKKRSGVGRIKRGSRQVNQYDKILRENIEAALPGLIKNLLNIQVVNAEELPDDIQHTKERKPDVLKKVTDKKGQIFVLHIEFQVKDEPKMVLRMAEYYIMLLRKYELPVRQYVIYVGAGNSTMTDYIRSESMHFKYQLIALSAVDYHLLLRSDNPEEKMMAILGDFGDDNPRRVIENIVNQIVAVSKGEFSKLRHIRQLRILAQLRNLEAENISVMDDLTNFFTVEKDFLYIRGQRDGMEKGMEKGIEKGKEVFVKKLLRHTDFTIAKIAELSEVTVAFVKKVKKSL